MQNTLQTAQQPFYLKPAYRFKTIQQQKPEELTQDGPGRRLRKNVANVRKHIDYIANVLNHIENRLWQSSKKERLVLQPDILYQQLVSPPASTLDSPVDCVLSKFVRSATNKVKCPVYTLCYYLFVKWTPEGKRLITGASSGEFTLWNGTAFNFETILQAHDVAVRALKWSHNDQWMVSADHDGFVKYWQPNMNNVHMFQAHKDEPIRSLCFSPTDLKIVTGSDDSTARIWDFSRCAEERILRGHGADVRCVDWHPTKGLIATGSRDSQQPIKLWDPKTVEWNKNGNWLLTGSRDHLIKLYDIRIMKEIQTFRGHKKEVSSLAWHPVHEGLFVSGGGDGSLGYWLVNSDKELALLEQAHDQAIWTLEWHPLGHILATGSNDNNTKFWARNRPGDTQEDIFGLTSLSTINFGILTNVSIGQNNVTDESILIEENLTSTASNISNSIPGLGLDEEIYGEINRDVPAIPSLPGLGGSHFDDSIKNSIGAKKTLIKQPPPKKAQRQFERMWMVSRPGGGNEFDDEDIDVAEEGGFFNLPSTNTNLTANNFTNLPLSVDTMRQSKLSLLGPPPIPGSVQPQSSPSLLSKPINTNSTNNKKTEWPTNPLTNQMQPPSLLSQRIPPPVTLGNNSSAAPPPPFLPIKKNQNWRTTKTREKQGFFYNSGSHW